MCFLQVFADFLSCVVNFWPGDDFLGDSSAKTSIFPYNFLERQSCRDPYLSIRISRRTQVGQAVAGVRWGGTEETATLTERITSGTISIKGQRVGAAFSCSAKPLSEFRTSGGYLGGYGMQVMRYKQERWRAPEDGYTYVHAHIHVSLGRGGYAV